MIMQKRGGKLDNIVRSKLQFGIGKNIPMTKNNIRKPANELLADFLKENNMDFAVRRQQVRYTDDNAMIIEPPRVVVEYKDVIDKELDKQKSNLTVKN